MLRQLFDYSAIAVFRVGTYSVPPTLLPPYLIARIACADVPDIFTRCSSSVAIKDGPGLLCGIVVVLVIHFVNHSTRFVFFFCSTTVTTANTGTTVTTTNYAYLPPSVCSDYLPHRTTSPPDHELPAGFFLCFIICYIC